MAFIQVGNFVHKKEIKRCNMSYSTEEWVEVRGHWWDRIKKIIPFKMGLDIYEPWHFLLQWLFLKRALYELRLNFKYHKLQTEYTAFFATMKL